VDVAARAETTESILVELRVWRPAERSTVYRRRGGVGARAANPGIGLAGRISVA
jgi:hypothetical protein